MRGERFNGFEGQFNHTKDGRYAEEVELGTVTRFIRYLNRYMDRKCLE